MYSSYIVICVCNGVFCVTAIVFNSVTIHAIRKTSSLPKALKTLLLSLAVSDLGVGLLVHPLFIARLVVDMKQNTVNNPTYNITNSAYFILALLCAYASFFGVTALSVDRFLAIHFHLRYQERVTHQRVVASVMSIWAFSAFLSLVRKFWVPNDVSYKIVATVEIIWVLTTVLLNYKLYIAVQHHIHQIQALQVQQAKHNEEMSNATMIRKAAVGTFYIYLVFLICWVPDICIHVVIATSKNSTLITHLHHYAATLAYLNSSLNPLIYCWKMRHIRLAIIDILRKIFSSHN